jgi:hypothetical protein
MRKKPARATRKPSVAKKRARRLAPALAKINTRYARVFKRLAE